MITAISATITHHLKDEGLFESNYGLIWYESDNLAFSERKYEEDNEKVRWDLFTPLVSPFFKVRNPNNPSEALTEVPYLQLRQIDSIELASFKKPEIIIESYKAIRSGLEEDLKITQSYKPYNINLLLMLFEKHLSNVPLITLEIFKDTEEQFQKHPDNSIFNHLKLPAVIAGCIYHFCRETYPDKWDNNELFKDEILNPPPDGKPFLLIGGDISRVQKFLYTITSKDALRSLKGRSLHLELLVEHVVSELIESLGLTRSNIIFSGRGPFYILFHNIETVEAAISRVKTNIDSFLFYESKGNLQLHLTYVYETSTSSVEVDRETLYFIGGKGDVTICNLCNWFFGDISYCINQDCSGI